MTSGRFGCFTTKLETADFWISPAEGVDDYEKQVASGVEVPGTKTITAERAFSVASSTIWNDLLLKLRQSTNFDGFETELKTHLFTTCQP